MSPAKKSEVEEILQHAMLQSEAARRAGVSPTAIQKWIESGKLPASHLAGGTVVVFDYDLEKVIQQRAYRGGAAIP